MYIEQLKNEVEEKTTSVNLDPNSTALLVVDLSNDNCSADGYLAKLGVDLNMGKTIQPQVVDMVEKARRAGVPVIYVQFIYNFSYIPEIMKSKFNDMGLKEGLAMKGTLGAKFIDALPMPPDMWLVKSYFSSFSEHAFLFDPQKNKAVLQYLSAQEKEDAAFRERGEKTMHDYFAEAAQSESNVNVDNLSEVLATEVISLTAYLRCKGIESLIITGASTHVCVDAAISGATERGIQPIVPIDAVASEDLGKHYVFLHHHAMFKAKLTRVEQIQFIPEDR